MHKNFLYFLLKHKVSATCVQRWGIFCFLTRYGSTLFVPLQKKTFLGHFLKALVLYAPRLYVGQKVHFPCIMYLMQPHYLPSLGSVKKGFGKEGSRPQEETFNCYLRPTFQFNESTSDFDGRGSTEAYFKIFDWLSYAMFAKAYYTKAV